ncbi:hypothetical protein [Yoonia maritima]|uniref:hypothetical protein n=1 Tax=Yoonia maritima TaxID=1435347 RepID=UPI00373625C2
MKNTVILLAMIGMLAACEDTMSGYPADDQMSAESEAAATSTSDTEEPGDRDRDQDQTTSHSGG